MMHEPTDEAEPLKPWPTFEAMQHHLTQLNVAWMLVNLFDPQTHPDHRAFLEQVRQGNARQELLDIYQATQSLTLPSTQSRYEYGVKEVKHQTDWFAHYGLDVEEFWIAETHLYKLPVILPLRGEQTLAVLVAHLTAWSDAEITQYAQALHEAATATQSIDQAVATDYEQRALRFELALRQRHQT